MTTIRHPLDASNRPIVPGELFVYAYRGQTNSPSIRYGIIDKLVPLRLTEDGEYPLKVKARVVATPSTLNPRPVYFRFPSRILQIPFDVASFDTIFDELRGMQFHIRTRERATYELTHPGQPWDDYRVGCLGHGRPDLWGEYRLTCLHQGGPNP
jgi:hypothetical protein